MRQLADLVDPVVQRFAAAVIDQAEAFENALDVLDFKFIMHGRTDGAEDLGHAHRPAVRDPGMQRVIAGGGNLVIIGIGAMDLVVFGIEQPQFF